MTLNDICDLIVDCPHSTAQDEGTGYPLIRTPNIGKGRFILDGVHRVSKEVYNRRNSRAIPQDDDLIFAREAPAGNVAIIKHGEKVCLGQRTVLLRPNKSLVNPDYLVYYLLSTEQQYKLLGAANGATVTHINIPVIRNLPVELPALKTQNKIASILSAYDNLIENNQKRIKLLEQMAQRLYQEWFVRFRFPGYEKAKFVDGIPQGWEKCKLKDMIAFNPVYRIKKGSVYTKIPMEALPTDGLSIDTDSIMAEDSSSGTHFMNGDVLCAKITPCLENGKTGLVACLQEDEVGVGSTEFIVMHGERVDSFFVYCIARDERFRQQAINSMNGADGRQRADISFIQNRQWILPDKQIIRQFKALTDKIVATVLRLEQQNKNLTKQRDLLLPRLMSGKLAV